MLIIKTIDKLQKHLSNLRTQGNSIGFVPTMGALHQGHISLVDRAKTENQVVVVSIFVNPTQFNDKADLDKYPITIEADTDMLINAGVDILFLPSVTEIYPDDASKQPVMDLGYMDTVLEAAARPGHFAGVAIILKRLLTIVQPNKLYMGQKDFQQYQVTRQLVKHFNLPVDVVRCDIVREPDGLAMSSRNVRLSGEHRVAATELSKALFYIKEHANDTPLTELTEHATQQLNSHPLIEVAYLQAVEGPTLKPVSQMNEADEIAVVLAAKVQGVHLLDNVIIS